MPSSRSCRSSYDCIVKIKGVTTRPILFSQLMRSDGEGAMNPEELFAGNRTPASEQERVHEDELHSLMRKILDWAISFLSESSQGMVPAVWVCESAGAMGRGAERAPQAVRRLALRFRPSVVVRRVRPRLAAVREDEGVQRRRMPVLLGAQGARRLQRPGHHASRHSGDVAPAHEQALGAHRRAGRKPQARMVARRVRPRLPDGRPRQGGGQAGLPPVLLGEEEAREADKARLALGPSARKERGRRVGASCP